MRGLLTFCYLAISAATVAAGPATFQLLDPPRAAHWLAHALSFDGRVVAVNAGGHYYLWTADGGYRVLGLRRGKPAGGSAGDGRELASGLSFCRLAAAGETQVHKMTLVR